MRSLLVCLAMVFGVVSMQGQKTRFGQELPLAKPGTDYPVVLHVYGVHVRTDCEDRNHFNGGDCVNVVFADVTLNGRKLELEGSDGQLSWRWTGNIPDKPDRRPLPLKLGDFHARTLKGSSGSELGDEYELLLPNNRVLRCVVTGMQE